VAPIRVPPGCACWTKADRLRRSARWARRCLLALIRPVAPAAVRRLSAIAASAELQERDALKNVSLAAAMTTALLARGVADPTAHLASEMGVLALKRGYANGPKATRTPPTS
jgi:hypothetical protein